jgi:hypothetical protein
MEVNKGYKNPQGTGLVAENLKIMVMFVIVGGAN